MFQAIIRRTVVCVAVWSTFSPLLHGQELPPFNYKRLGNQLTIHQGNADAIAVHQLINAIADELQSSAYGQFRIADPDHYGEVTKKIARAGRILTSVGNAESRYFRKRGNWGGGNRLDRGHEIVGDVFYYGPAQDGKCPNTFWLFALDGTYEFQMPQPQVRTKGGIRVGSSAALVHSWPHMRLWMGRDRFTVFFREAIIENGREVFALNEGIYPVYPSHPDDDRDMKHFRETWPWYETMPSLHGKLVDGASKLSDLVAREMVELSTVIHTIEFDDAELERIISLDNFGVESSLKDSLYDRTLAEALDAAEQLRTEIPEYLPALQRVRNKLKR